MKGLPLTYSKDMQDDKEPAFEAADTLELSIAAMTGMIGDLKVNTERLKESAGAGFTTATDIADWLVRVAGVPFRQAHHITGRIVRIAEDRGCGLEDLSLADLKGVDERITNDVFSVLGVEASASSRTSFGGTAPANVAKAVVEARKRFL